MTKFEPGRRTARSYSYCNDYIRLDFTVAGDPISAAFIPHRLVSRRRKITNSSAGFPQSHYERRCAVRLGYLKGEQFNDALKALSWPVAIVVTIALFAALYEWVNINDFNPDGVFGRHTRATVPTLASS
jgi:hypothetical protein